MTHTYRTQVRNSVERTRTDRWTDRQTDATDCFIPSRLTRSIGKQYARHSVQMFSAFESPSLPRTAGMRVRRS